MSVPDHEHNKNEPPAMQPQEEDHMPPRNTEPPTGRNGLAFVMVIAVLATMVGILLLRPEALQQDLLLSALTVVLAFAAMIAGVRFCASHVFSRRKRRPAAPKKPSMTKSSVGRTAEEDRHPLRYGDKIPDAHLWWF